MNGYTTFLDYGVLGELRTGITYEYHPAVEAVLYPVDKAEEGSAEFIEIDSVVVMIPGRPTVVELTELAISEISEIIIAECHQ